MQNRSGNQSLTHTQALSDEQAEQIFQASLRVLEITGARVESEGARRLLKSGGATIDGDVARIPREMVHAALESTPKRLVIHGRDGAPGLKLGEGNTYYCPGMTCPNVLDPFTGERRPFTCKDAALVGLLVDALPNLDFAIGGGIIDDVTPILAAAYEFATLAANTSKPLYGWAHNEVVLEDIYQMAAAMSGGEDNFRKSPNCLIFINPVSPLVHSPEVAERVLLAAEHRIPIIVWPSTLAGGTVPVTMAGALAVALAEVLSALAINQAKQPGAPFVFAVGISQLDMKRGNATWSPFRALANVCVSDVLRHLAVPRYVLAAGTNAKILDEQAAMEVSFNLLAAGLTGSDLIAGLGSIEAAMTCSPGVLVLANEAADMARRVRRGVTVDDASLALDVVDRVGPGGHFLMEEHTLLNFRSEHWEPLLLEVGKYEEWDGSTLGQRVKRKIEEIQASHRPIPLSDATQSAIDGVLRRAEAREARG